ncbi:EAL domain-containing protein [Sphingomonas sp. BGYR3]|uniref:putative bifunctional diguanylate cyclase/phosphodiesterase n=1 Tax=Sphingomonas sp. BGYR3 TaxID=2975483 RepID=UPI0021A73CDF|nr:EAL domain-containing protein [Sphingomonas sp. BGYR3]
MSDAVQSQFPHPRIDFRALLGLYDPADDTDWGPIRAAQLNAGRQLALLMLGASVLTATLVVMLFRAEQPLWQLACWWAFVAAISSAVAFRRLAAGGPALATAEVRQVRDTMLDGVALAAVWSVPPLAFSPGATTDTLFGLWMILAVLMAAAAFAMAALPLATLVFLAITGIAAAVMLAIQAHFALAAATMVFMALLMLACFARGESLVVLRANEIALGERDQTVSLLLREFEDDGSDWLWEIDAQRRLTRASPRFARSIGVEPADITGRSLLEVLAGPSWEAGNFHPGLRELSERLKQREPFADILLPVHVADQQRWWEITASPRYDDRGTFLGYRGVGSDVTEARASAEKISRLARYDLLTGLPNRLSINESLARALERADQWRSRCALMMIDLDRFKAVNDTLGHQVGDRLLGKVAQRLAQLAGENAVIGRLGGDEFALIIPDATDSKAVEQLANRIIDTLSRPYEVDQNTLFIGASIGLAIGPRDGRSAETLIRSADLALYRSKDAGGGHVHIYEPQLHVEAEEKRKLEIALRSALDLNEFSLNYQPVVDATDGRLTGFEALLRWYNPEHGQVSPARFIPLAEEARLIPAIGAWVLKHACAEAARWPANIRIAVNVSAEQLYSPNFVGLVSHTLQETGLPAERLELEVTESVFMREGTSAIRVLERVLDLGVRLSLDDFGTGYSSLGYLSRTRFSSIKIDRSFVQGASRGEKEAIAIIRAVVALAQSLEMATTAEGVETEQEHELVRMLGCTKVQGYYFGRPLPVDEARAIALNSGSSSAAA